MDKPEPLDDPPNCIKCGETMWFSCTELEKPGFVHHVYECKKCWSTQSFVTAKRPLMVMPGRARRIE